MVVIIQDNDPTRLGTLSEQSCVLDRRPLERMLGADQMAPPRLAVCIRWRLGRIATLLDKPASIWICSRRDAVAA
jgi:hypothetical protein